MSIKCIWTKDGAFLTNAAWWQRFENGLVTATFGGRQNLWRRWRNECIGRKHLGSSSRPRNPCFRCEKCWMQQPFWFYLANSSFSPVAEITTPKLNNELSKIGSEKQHRVACHCHYSISKSPYLRMATALLNFTKSQPRNHYLSTMHQSSLPIKSKLNFIRNERKRIEDRCSSNVLHWCQDYYERKRPR